MLVQQQQQELLPIVVKDNNTLVDAQLLHQKLRVKTKFADWIKIKISRFGFEKNQDYFSEISEKLRVGRKSINYLISLDMAKELAMLEENEIGRQIRRYFIAKEKELRKLTNPLPIETQMFKGLKVRNINNRKMYPYREFLENIGLNSKSGGVHHRIKSYPGHFVKMDNLQYISQEFANHLFHAKQLANNRIIIKNMQPVLALNFGEPLQ